MKEGDIVYVCFRDNVYSIKEDILLNVRTWKRGVMHYNLKYFGVTWSDLSIVIPKNKLTKILFGM